MKKQKLIYQVWIEYDGYDTSLDKKYTNIAKEYKCKETGAGFGFGARDISFETKNLINAEKLAKRFKRFKKIERISLMYYNQEYDLQDCWDVK